MRAVLWTSPINIGLSGESTVRLALRIQELRFLHQAPDLGHVSFLKVSFPQEILCFSHGSRVGGPDCVFKDLMGLAQ